MKGNVLKSMIIGAIVITVTIAGWLSFASTLSTEYGIGLELGRLNRSVEVIDEIGEAYELFEEEENMSENWLGTIIYSGGKILWSFITLIIGIPGTLGDLIHDFALVIGIPPLFLAGISALILTIGLFALLDLLSKG